MEISNYTIEDFVLDPSFKKWVMQPNAESNLFWENLLAENPLKYEEAKKARRIIIQLNSKKQQKLSSTEFSTMWGNLDKRLSEEAKVKPTGEDKKVIPLHSISVLEKVANRQPSRTSIFDYFKCRVACVLISAISFGTLLSWLATDSYNTNEKKTLLVFEEHNTVPGVKSHLTLSDGSQVILNSGSELKYRKNFNKDKREIFLKGEAFFDVTKDSLRPFIVHSLAATTTALGTSFNVRAYSGETIDVSLLTGKVEVKKKALIEESITLLPGEALRIDTENNQLVKSSFNQELVIGWTKKRIIFQKTPLLEELVWSAYSDKKSAYPSGFTFGKISRGNIRKCIRGLEIFYQV